MTDAELTRMHDVNMRFFYRTGLGWLDCDLSTEFPNPECLGVSKRKHNANFFSPQDATVSVTGTIVEVYNATGNCATGVFTKEGSSTACEKAPFEG